MAVDFGLAADEAGAIWQHVAAGASRWKDVFAAAGVAGSDIDYIADFLDPQDKLEMRAAAGGRTPPRRTGRR
jgi:hypothetical protein